MKNYIEQATRTESIDLFKVDSPRLLHAAVGVCTEAGELLLADDGDVVNVKEEMGDILWYIAIACSELEITFGELLEMADVERAEADPLKAMLGGAGDALDCVKRSLFYGVDLDIVKFQTHMATLLLSIEYLAADCRWTIAELQETNISKLSRRYPEKFTTEAAVNRNISAEMEAVSRSQ